MERGLQRKKTVELQRRPGRSQTTLRSSSSMRVDAANVDPSLIPQTLKECYAPEEFDEASTLLVCNFPPGCHPFAARNFMSWWGPVIRVERAPSIRQESNFLIVFGAPTYAEKVLNTGPITYEDQKTLLYSRRVDDRGTMWQKLSTFWSEMMGGGTPTNSGGSSGSS